MKTMEHLGWKKHNNAHEAGKELNVVFDNCPGQNKNNTVLHLIPYLVEMNYFRCVNFIFLIAGHTKNACDRWFNRLKKTYRLSQAYTMESLKKQLESEHVKILSVEEGDMKDYSEFLNRFYKKMPKIEGYHIFSCNIRDKKQTTFPMMVRESNLEDAASFETNAYRVRFVGCPKDVPYAEAVNARYMLIRDAVINPIPSPGINLYQVELFKNYRSNLLEVFRDVTCPRPSDEVFALIKKEKNSKLAVKKETIKRRRMVKDNRKPLLLDNNVNKN